MKVLNYISRILSKNDIANYKIVKKININNTERVNNYRKRGRARIK